VELVERESALAELAGLARRAQAGDGGLVLVAGEAGVGKTALLERLARDLPDARWSWGACDGLFTPRPLGPLFDVAAQLGGPLAELGRAGAGRDELFAALLRQVSEPAVLDIVVIEDVHWADEATIDLLRFLGRRLKTAPALLIASYRDDGLAADHRLRLALGDLAAQRSTSRVRLDPLSAAGVRLLSAASGLDPAELFRLTGGNPFYITEVLQAGMREVPAAARDAVLARAARLGAQARELLDVAALVGTRVEPELIEAVAPGSAALVDEILASGLLAEDRPEDRPAEGGGRLRFRHEIARLTVEQAIRVHRRGPIHRRILDALVAADSRDDARLAFHAEGAGDGPAALRYASAAARRAVDLASHQEAAAQYRRAVRFAADAEPETAAGLYGALARETSLVDQWAEAEQAGTRALELWRQLGDRQREGDTLNMLACVHERLCRGAAAAAAAESAVEILRPLGAGRELARAYGVLAAMRMVAGRHAEAVGLARQAAEMAQAVDATAVLSDALNTLGCSLSLDDDGWKAPLRQALVIAVDAGLPEQAGRAFANLHSISCEHRRFAEAERYYADGFRYTDEHDIGVYVNCLRGSRVFMLEQTGQWDEALSIGGQLLAIAASPINRIQSLVVLGQIGARRGADDAWQYLDEAAATADGSGEMQWIVAARLARAEAHWLAGDTAVASAEADLARTAAAATSPWDRGAALSWLRRCGSRQEQAGPVAEPYQRQLDGYPEKSAQLWTDFGCRYQAALTLYDTTEERLLRRALELFTELGATAAIKATRRKMRRAGIRSIPVGPRSATRADPLGLTRREHEILTLVGAGLTSAEIAARLFISAKTVDHHVASAVGKLGAPTRAAAAARLRPDS
jgi:DNA-binding CsgD family transcriptional regulator/tetratricopeptide (TPR) repeat protein